LNGTARVLILCLAIIAGLAGLVTGWVAGEKSEFQTEVEQENSRILAAKVPTGTIDEETGAYKGVKWGDSVSTVKRRLGEPIETDGVFSPQVSWHASWNGFNPPTCGAWKRKSGDFYAMVYREVVFNIVGGKVCSYEVAGSGWSTTGGIKAGDSVEEIQARFGEEACQEGSHSENPYWKQWTCHGQTDSGIRMKLAGNPVSSIGIEGGG
jgi:hypothetical protein